MGNSEHIQEIVKRLKSLSTGQQRQVLDYILEMSGETPKGISGKELLRLVGAISKEDLEIMKQAIEEGCEQVYGSK